MDEFTRLAIVLVAVVVFTMIVVITIQILRFRRDLKAINGEIRRTHGAEREHWKRKRRRLWLSLFFPFFG